MKPHFAIFAALAASTILALASDGLEPLPKVWFITGESPQHYIAGIDRRASDSQAGAKLIASRDGAGGSWGTLMRMAGAEGLRGERVRFSARIKTQDVSGWAGLWLRADKMKGPPWHEDAPRWDPVPAAFYNSQDRPITGSTGWQLRSVTLDLPDDVGRLAMGVIHNGSGKVWIDDLKLEVVGKDVPVDRLPGQPPLDPLE